MLYLSIAHKNTKRAKKLKRYTIKELGWGRSRKLSYTHGIHLIFCGHPKIGKRKLEIIKKGNNALARIGMTTFNGKRTIIIYKQGIV